MQSNNTTLKIPAIFYLAATVIVLATVMYSSTIVTQFLMAVFIAIISAKPVAYLQSKGLSNGLSVGIVILFIILITVSLGGILGTSVANFTSNLEVYNSKVSGGFNSVFDFLERMGVNTSKDRLLKTVDPGVIMTFTAKLLNGLGNLMGNMAMILLIVGFMLAESSSYGVKLKAILNQPENSMSRITTAMDQINQYLGIKTITSLITGVVIGLSLWAIGVDFPFMWGLIAFLFNYIPNIGSFIAAIPALFMAFISLGGFGLLWTGLIFVVVNIGVGNILEPNLMGKGLGISTLVVLLSLIFWGYILGTTGMFLSIPLTLAAKIAFESNESTKWVAVLLGTEDDAIRNLEKKN